MLEILRAENFPRASRQSQNYNRPVTTFLVRVKYLPWISIYPLGSCSINEGRERELLRTLVPGKRRFPAFPHLPSTLACLPLHGFVKHELHSWVEDEDEGRQRAVPQSSHPLVGNDL